MKKIFVVLIIFCVLFQTNSFAQKIENIRIKIELILIIVFIGLLNLVYTTASELIWDRHARDTFAVNKKNQLLHCLWI